MSSDSTESEIRQFYEEASIPATRLDAMLDHGRTAATVSRWKRIAGLSAIACVLTSVACAYFWIQLNQSNQELKLANSELQKTLEPKETPSPVDSRPVGQFQLVAIRHHGDRCPLCRSCGETFESLKEELADEPIDFSLVDFRDAPDEVKSSLDRFEMNSLVDERRHKALIALRLPSGEVMELDVTDQSIPIEEQVAKIIEAKK